MPAADAHAIPPQLRPHYRRVRARSGTRGCVWFVRLCVKREMITTSDRWDTAQPDDPVTVPYHPAKPKRSVLYDYGDYECLPA